jgi:pimeloyl-ACP methyl ester carboxylesterase
MRRMLAGLPVTERRIELAGTATAVVEAGDGPPLVLRHGGIECGGPIWAPLGDSEPVDRLDPTTFAAWFSALLRMTCDQPPVLVAHSLGGLWGRHDRFVPLGLAEAASTRLGWPLHVVDAAGHVPHVEQPDALTEALT